MSGDALAGLWALCGGGALVVALSALAVLDRAGLLPRPSLDRAALPPKMMTTRDRGRGPGTPPAPVAPTKEGTR